MEQETTAVETLTSDEFINQQIKKFDIADAKIAELKKEYETLKIHGIDDKDGYKVVHNARMDIKARRVAVEKMRKNLNENAQTYISAINSEAKRITELLKPIEEHLQQEEDNFKAEKERIKQEQERQEQERIQNRVTALLNSGCNYDGVLYRIGEVRIDALDIKKLSDEDFDKHLSQVKEAHAVILQEKEEQERKEKEERERLERERKEMEERQEEMRRKQEELEEREAEMKRQQDALHKQMIQNRCNQLASIGLVPGPEQYTIGNVLVSKEQITTLNTTEWDEMIAYITPQVEEQIAELKKQEEERQREEEAERKRKIEAQEAERKRQEEAERERQEALKPDKQKLLELGNAILQIKLPTVTNEAAQELLNEVKRRLELTQQHITKRVSEL